MTGKGVRILAVGALLTALLAFAPAATVRAATVTVNDTTDENHRSGCATTGMGSGRDKGV